MQMHMCNRCLRYIRGGDTKKFTPFDGFSAGSAQEVPRLSWQPPKSGLTAVIRNVTKGVEKIDSDKVLYSTTHDVQAIKARLVRKLR